jgi:riboflavin synthase
MFSGIISKLATVTRAKHDDGSLHCVIATGYPDLELGESIAVNGVCLTVTSFDVAGMADFFISAETLARSNLGQLEIGTRVNLERALTLETRLSGHLVQGHVDGKGILASSLHSDGAYLLTFKIARDLARYCVEKGSITINGISLTLNGVADEPTETTLSITIIPHTWTHTNLQDLKIGDLVNIEVDVMAKYAERLCQPYLKP